MWARTKSFAKYANDPDNPEAAMSQFMAHFVPLWKERKFKVVVIGHSAGSIFAGHWLEALDRWYPEGKVDVMFLAPACTYAFAADRVEAFKKHVDRFVMLGLSDPIERADAMLSVSALPKQVRGWYDASMLYYVSNNLEGPFDVPLLGMERFVRLSKGFDVGSKRELTDGEKEDISQVTQALKLDQTAVWSGTSPQKYECAAASHIAFWTDEATRRSIARFVAEADN